MTTFKRLREDAHFRHLSAQVHAQEILIDGMLVALFPMLPLTARADILGRMRRNAADIGAKGRLGDADAVFKADVKVAAQSFVEAKLRLIEKAWPPDEASPET